ncbi:MAG TPA: helix-turn-helix transcriptional regulator [Pseudonocardiaceae bacterium]|nr:helix-turn-helix transcriptional regulator [Pseudonocardiaceae bacterium]
MLAEPDREMYGLEIGKAVGVPSGTLHPLLARLERFGWLESRWEIIEPAEEGRPRRRYYRLSPAGAERGRAALARLGIPVGESERSHQVEHRTVRWSAPRLVDGA